MFDRHYYKSLSRSMVLTVFLVSLTPLALVSAITSYQFHTSYKDRVQAHLRELVLKHKRNIDGFLAEKLAVVRVLADIIPEGRFRDPAALQAILKSLQERHHGAFVDMGLVDADGVQVAYAGPLRLERARYAETRWFREAMRHDLYVSDVFLGLRGSPHFIVAVRVRASGAEWILRATVDFESFNELVESVAVGQTGLAYIVNNQGEFQTRPRREAAVGPAEMRGILLRAAGAETRGDFSPESAAAGIRAAQSSVALDVIHEPAGGKDVLLLTAPLKDGAWTLVYQQDEADAYASLYHARNLSLFAILAGGVGILLMAVLVANRMVNRIVEADRERDMMNDQVIEAGKLASVGELAAGIAHEINNPLAIMLEEAGWVLDLLDDESLRGHESHPEMVRALKQIRQQGGRCRDITHKLLSFARKIDPTVKPVQVNDIVRDMAALSEQRAHLANVRVSVDLAPDLPEVPASPSELQQVLVNLINNAIDALERGGELKVSTRLDGGFVRLDVADNGMGIPKANMARIFDPFYTTKPVGKGTGLGLSICYGIVRKMGGEISVDSVLNQGTVFHIRLPIGEARA
ncbi:ATP-binding protein [Desulfovibrio aminophilus]|nr:PAS domain-containing sensor histidine kinase [Desulfovibrio aminophilus]MCM0756940.1 ATP-binding protein [Desulfovibrio aminophilus]